MTPEKLEEVKKIKTKINTILKKLTLIDKHLKDISGLTQTNL